MKKTGSSSARFWNMAVLNYTFGTKRSCTSQWRKWQKVHISGQVCFAKKIGSITFSQFYICLHLARDLHINIKKLWGSGSHFSRKTQNRPQNHNFCTIAFYRFTKAQQCNSFSVISPCDRCIPGRKMLPMRVLALCTQCIDRRAIQTAYTREADAHTTLTSLYL